jgi:N-acetylglucosaminyldiphosphoundecaprenol N-acetyl-beta-D-mannosaminyltransferase
MENLDHSTVDILGFPVARLSIAQVIARITTAIEGRVDTRKSRSEKTLHIVTANAEILYNAYENPTLGELLQQADMITPDGNGTVQAAIKLGQPVPERVTGVDLMWQLLPKAEQQGWRIYLLGASEAVITETVKVIKTDWPMVNLAGWHNGYFTAAERPVIIEDILKSGADLIFVALGFPAQDQFILQMQQQFAAGLAAELTAEPATEHDEGTQKNNSKHLPAVAIGVGGSFDAISGNVKRAPQWIQNLGLEWAYRFAQNPKRLKRATALPKFVLAVRRQVKGK